MKIRQAIKRARLRLAWFIMPDPLEVIGQKPKAPTPLWTSRRKAMFSQGYDPRDTATP